MNAPAYQGIKDFILARIHAGEWAEGDQVPSENELAREFSVARMTVNRALRELTICKTSSSGKLCFALSASKHASSIAEA